ncbi:MAG: CARDB domain-containing protein [Gemmatimonadaceae bacterium]
MRTAIALVAFAFFLPPVSATAQAPVGFEYATKIICGVPDRPALAQGAYYTAINIHNPGPDTVRFRQKLALTRAAEAPGPITPFWASALAPDQAAEIDCTDMFRRSQMRLPFLKGFAVIQSPSELDVVGVYTASSKAGQPVVALELERVAGRRVGRAGCDLPDLIVESILPPTFVQATHSTRIEAVIRNIGAGPAAASLARVIDPSTFISPGVPQNAIAPNPPLGPGASANVVFSLPYWVFNPDASLEVTADYKNQVPECREDNNVKDFAGIG